MKSFVVHFFPSQLVRLTVPRVLQRAKVSTLTVLLSVLRVEPQRSGRVLRDAETKTRLGITAGTEDGGRGRDLSRTMFLLFAKARATNLDRARA